MTVTEDLAYIEANYVYIINQLNKNADALNKMANPEGATSGYEEYGSMDAPDLFSTGFDE